MALNAVDLAFTPAVATILAVLTAEAHAVDGRNEQGKYLLSIQGNELISRGLTTFGQTFSSVRAGNSSSTPTVVYVGDSLTFGYGGTYPYNYYVRLPGCNGIPFASYNIGINGETLQTMKSMAPNNLDPLFAYNAPVNIAVIWGGTNDIANGASVAQTLSYLRTFARHERALGFEVTVATMISRIDLDSQKDAYNSFIRDNWAQFSDGLADLAVNPNLGTDGAYSNATYFQSDKIHLTNTGYALVGSIVQAALNGLVTRSTKNISTVCSAGY